MRLQLLTHFKVIQALAFILIPAILWLIVGYRMQSISAYVSTSPVAFSLLLSQAGTLFLYDGIMKQKHWYNIIIGSSLIGVVVFNHLEYPIIHYAFAGVFFIGSLFNMVFFSNNKERLIKGIVALIVLFVMAGTFIFGWYSIFWAEWVGMLPISIHYVLEEKNKIT